MYVAYCKNKPFSNSLLIEHGGNFFAVSEQERICYCPGVLSHANVHIVVLITCNQLCLFLSDVIMYRFCTERAMFNGVL